MKFGTTEALVASIIAFVYLIASIIIVGYYLGVYEIPPVEETNTDSIETTIDSLNIELLNIDSIRNENIKNAATLNNTESVELFKWLLSR